MSDRLPLDGRETAASPVAAHEGANLAAIRMQVQRVLESPPFRTSKRCRLFLEHVIEHALTKGEPLKERSVGVQVFGREPSYDTSADPIVRVTAGDIRRRLGQYYAEPAHQRELRVDLPSGSYNPSFTWPSDFFPDTSSPSAPFPSAVAVPPAGGRAAAAAPASGWSRRAVGAAGLLGVLALLGALTVAQQAPTTFDRFWAPVIDSKIPVLVCTGSIEVYELPGEVKRAANAVAANAVSTAAASLAATGEAAPSGDARPITIEPGSVQRVGAGFVSVADAVAIVRLTSLLQEHGTPFHIRENRATSFADLRTSPVVLLGMFSNTWTLQLGSDFRFVPEIDRETGMAAIRDRQRPGGGWQLQRAWPKLANTHDYALVSRVLDRATGTIVVIGAGITPFGTTAAAEFLTSRQHLDAALRGAPADWPTRNLQVVLKTRVIDGAAAPPQVLATHVW